jgi:hypothetical protein
LKGRRLLGPPPPIGDPKVVGDKRERQRTCPHVIHKRGWVGAVRHHSRCQRSQSRFRDRVSSCVFTPVLSAARRPHERRRRERRVGVGYPTPGYPQLVHLVLVSTGIGAGCHHGSLGQVAGLTRPFVGGWTVLDPFASRRVGRASRWKAETRPPTRFAARCSSSERGCRRECGIWSSDRGRRVWPARAV